MLATDDSDTVMLTITINAGNAIEGQGNALRNGRAIVRFGETCSSDKFVEVTLQRLQQEDDRSRKQRSPVAATGLFFTERFKRLSGGRP